MFFFYDSGKGGVTENSAGRRREGEGEGQGKGEGEGGGGRGEGRGMVGVVTGMNRNCCYIALNLAVSFNDVGPLYTQFRTTIALTLSSIIALL